MPVTVRGVREVLKELDALDHKAKLGIDKALRSAATEMVGQARMLVDPEGLSGWGKWRGGYSPTSIAAGIKVKRGGRRPRGRSTRNYIGVQNTNAAGAIWELAGRRSSGNSPQGRAFIDAITRRGGPASRTVWAAADQTDFGDVHQRVISQLDEARRLVQAGINRIP